MLNRFFVCLLTSIFFLNTYTHDYKACIFHKRKKLSSRIFFSITIDHTYRDAGRKWDFIRFGSACMHMRGYARTFSRVEKVEVPFRKFTFSFPHLLTRRVHLNPNFIYYFFLIYSNDSYPKTAIYSIFIITTNIFPLV